MSTVVQGYWRDPLGRLVPIESVKDVDKTRDALVRELSAKALDLSRQMEDFRRQTEDDIQAFVELSLEQYGVQRRGAKGNMTLISYDGALKIECDSAERLEFDERLQAAKVLIDECLREWTKDSGAEIRAIIDDAFQVDRKGRINARRILSLRRLDIQHPKWLVAMQAIGEAVSVVGTKSYLRFYRRDDQGRYKLVPLDMAAF